MAINVHRVRPGDLITATYINGIVDALETLQAEIDALSIVGSPPSGLAITSVEPDPVQAGATMTIHGHEFAVPAVVNTVTLGGRQLTDFPAGSTDQILNVGVPGDLAGLPRTMTLSVSTPESTRDAHASVQVVPAVIVEPGGEVVITDVTGPLGTIAVGETFLFQFELNASAAMAPQNFAIQAIYRNAEGARPSAWAAGTSYVGTRGPNHVVTVTPEAPVTVGVNVRVPERAESVDLAIEALSDGVAKEGPIVPITVGQAPEPTDPSISLRFGTNQRRNVHPETFEGFGDGLAILFGQQAVVNLEAAVEHGGTYQFTGEVENGGELWGIEDLPATLELGDGQSTPIQFQLRLRAATPPAQPVTRFFRFTATRQEREGVGQISNFMRFPIGGFQL